MSVEIISRRSGKEGGEEKNITKDGFDDKKVVMCSVLIRDIWETVGTTQASQALPGWV